MAEEYEYENDLTVRQTAIEQDLATADRLTEEVWQLLEKSDNPNDSLLRVLIAISEGVNAQAKAIQDVNDTLIALLGAVKDLYKTKERTQ